MLADPAAPACRSRIPVLVTAPLAGAGRTRPGQNEVRATDATTA
jgi:hypothetical protein